MAKNLPEFVGTYRALVLGNTVEPSSKAKIPQLKLRVYLTEYYDEGEGEWINVEDEHWTMTAFLILYSREKEPSLNHQQVCSVFGWDGCGFDLLCGPDLEGMTIQVRVKESDGNEKFPMEITWIDTEDADPKGGFKKKTAEEIKEMNAEFAEFLGKKSVQAATVKKGVGKTTVKGASAKAKLAAARVKANEVEVAVESQEPDESGELEEPEADVPPAQSVEEKKKALLAKSKRLRKEQEAERAAEVKKKTTSKKGTVKSNKGRVIEAGESMPEDFNKKDAWFTITELRDEDATDELQAAEWQAAIEEVAPDGDEDQLDAEGWWEVKEAVLANIGA